MLTWIFVFCVLFLVLRPIVTAIMIMYEEDKELRERAKKEEKEIYERIMKRNGITPYYKEGVMRNLIS